MFKKSLLFTILILVLFLPNSFSSPEKPPILDRRVVIVSSYNPFNICYRPQLLGFIDYLREHGYMEDNEAMKIYYMRSKTKNITPDAIDGIASAILHKIMKSKDKPDYIFAVDDNAFNYVGIKLANNGYKVVFSGINLPLSFYRYKLVDTAQVAGVEETFSLNKLWKLLEISALFPKNYYILTTTQTFSSYTEGGLIKLLIKELKLHGINDYKIIAFSRIGQLANFISSIQDENFSVLFITMQRLYDSSEREIVSVNKIVQVIVNKNKKHLEVVFNPLLVKSESAAISISPDFYNMGQLAGKELMNFKPWQVLHPATRLCCNVKRLEELGLFYKIFSSKETREMIDELY